MRSRIEIPRNAFPLAWPPGLARCTARKSASFHGTTIKPSAWQEQGKPTRMYRSKRELSVAESRDDVLAELQRLGAVEPVIVSTNVRTRLDGLPYSNGKEPADPGVAVYFVLDGHETCVAIDHFDRVADNLRAIAKTIEAMRGIERWGGASLVAAVFTGFQGLPGPGVIVPARSWWDVLGVAAHAPTDEVEARALALSREFHPDKRPDDVDAAAKFAEVREALAEFRRERGIA